MLIYLQFQHLETDNIKIHHAGKLKICNAVDRYDNAGGWECFIRVCFHSIFKCKIILTANNLRAKQEGSNWSCGHSNIVSHYNVEQYTDWNYVR